MRLIKQKLVIRYVWKLSNIAVRITTRRLELENKVTRMFMISSVLRDFAVTRYSVYSFRFALQEFVEC